MNTSKSLKDVVWQIYWHGFNRKAAPGTTVPFDPEDYVAAIVEAVLEIIGEDEKPVPAVPGTGRRSHAWDGYRTLELFRNSLRAEQRKAIKEWQ